MTLLVTDPVDLLLDDGDLVVTTDLQFSRGLPAVLQSCRIALRMFAGEWFLDLDAGIPYWQSILAQKPAIAEKAARIAFRSALSLVDGVAEVLTLDVDYVATQRLMNITFQVRTVFGDTPSDEIELRTVGETPTGGA